MLRWTTAQLAAKSGVGDSTIRRLELLPGVPQAHARTLNELRLALEAAGIEFIGSPEDGPGVRLRQTNR